MSTKLTDKWECPQCNNEINTEECDQMSVSLLMRGQIEFTCGHCSEPLTADTSECGAGYVDINENWIYE